jgi:dTMP kinase
MSRLEAYKGTVLPGLINHTGVDNCGKTTQVRNLIARLEDAGVPVVTSKAYGPREKEVWGRWVDGILAAKNPLSDFAVTWLFHLLHKQQVNRAIKDINAGKIVVTDRWDESFLVYHDRYEPMSKRPKQMRWMWQDAFKGVVPETTLFYDISPAEARARSTRTQANNDGFDNKQIEYHQTMFEGMHELAQLREWSMIDARKSIAEVGTQVWGIIAPKYVHGLIGQLS